MELGKIIFTEMNGQLFDSILAQDDNGNILTRSDGKSGGPAALVPIMTQILRLEHPDQVIASRKLQRIMGNEGGGNRMKEQIDDSNLLRDANTLRIKTDSVSLLLTEVVKLISEEVNYSYKVMQLAYLISTGLVGLYPQYFVLNENLSISDPNLKSVDEMNKKVNSILQNIIANTSLNVEAEVDRLINDYKANPEVTDRMKDYLNVVGIEYLTKSGTSKVYQMFRRKAGMDRKQQEIFSQLLINIRKYKETKTSIKETIKYFEITEHQYRYYSADALKPLDELLEKIVQFDSDLPDGEDQV